jgi:hypothetical protein
MKLLRFIVCATLLYFGVASMAAGSWTVSYSPAFPSVDQFGDPFTGPPNRTVDLPLNADIQINGMETATYESRLGHAFFLLTETWSHDLLLTKGGLISGLAQLSTTDMPSFSDRAWIEIGGSTPWSMNIAGAWSLDPNPGGLLHTTPWMPWEWIAPSDGLYSLTLNLVSDDQLISNARFKDIQVPEGPTVFLLGCSLLGLMVLRKRLVREVQRDVDDYGDLLCLRESILVTAQAETPR